LDEAIISPRLSTKGLMQLIEAAEQRSAKSFVSAATLYNDQAWAKDAVVIDPEE
jgi:hypothetical protein